MCRYTWEFTADRRWNAEVIRNVFDESFSKLLDEDVPRWIFKSDLLNCVSRTPVTSLVVS